MSKSLLSFLLFIFILTSCKEEIFLDPSSKMSIDITNITSDKKKAYLNIPFESIFKIPVKNPQSNYIGNTNEYVSKTKELRAVVIPTNDLLEKGYFEIKVFGTPKTSGKDEIVIKLTPTDSLYSKTSNPFRFDINSIKTVENFENLTKNIEFLDSLFTANHSISILDKEIKFSDLTGTYEREYLNLLLSKLLSTQNYNLLSNAFEAQVIFDKQKNNSKNSVPESFTFKITKNSSTSYDLVLSNKIGKNYFYQKLKDINSTYLGKPDFQMSIDPESWLIDGKEKKPIDILPIKKLLATFTEDVLAKGKTNGKLLDSTSFDLGKQSFTTTTSNNIPLDTTEFLPILANFTPVTAADFPVEINLNYKFGEGFITSFYDTFLKKENDIVVFQITTKKFEKYTLLYKTTVSELDPKKLIYQVHFRKN